MSPPTVRKSGSSESAIEREVATTAYPAPRNAAVRPAPMPREAPVTTATRARSSARSARELLAAVDVVGRPGQSGVGHEVHGQRGDVVRSDHTPDRERVAQLLASRLELVAEQRRGEGGVDE